MSAALVESVREAVTAAQSATVHYGYREAALALESLDLPAILAALTEAESLRAQVAAGQAREVALRKKAKHALNVVQGRAAFNAVRELLSAPTDTAALRAFGERCAEAGQKDAFDEMSAMDAGVPRAQQDAAAIVDRVLGGS